MTDVSLVLKADNTQYIQKVKEAQSATQNLHNFNETSSKRRLGFIEQEEKRIQNMTLLRNKAYDTSKIEYYNRELAASKKHLDELETAGIKTEKGTSKLGTAFLKLGLAIAAAFSVQKIWDFIKVTAIAYDQQIQAEKKLLNALEGKERVQKRLLKQASDIQKTTIFKDEDIVNAQAYLAAQGRTEEQIKKTINVAIQLATVMGTDLMGATETLNMTYEGTIMRLGRLDGRLKGLTTEQLIHGAAIDLLGDKYKGFAEIAATEGLGSLKVLNNAWGDLKETFGEVWSEFLKVSGIAEFGTKAMGITTSILKTETIPVWRRYLALFGIGTKKVYAEVIQNQKDTNKELVKTDKEKNDELIAELKKFWETIKGVTGKETVAAEYEKLKEYYLNNRDAFFQYFDDLDERKEKEWKFDLDFGEKLFLSERAKAKKIYDDRIKNTTLLEDAEEKVLKAKQQNYAAAGQAVIDYVAIIDELAQREIEEAQRKRELLDTKIDETQSALETEVELYKAGYASNVAAKQKELAELKKARDKALKDEEDARKKAHTLKVVSLVAEQAVSLSKVIMAAEVAKMEARVMINNPITLIPGLALLASTRIAEAISIAAITASVIAASLSKFAKGGWTGEGKGRDNTGERMAGIVHEKEFVVRKGPAHRFRDVLEAINKDDKAAIFNSFNKLTPELLGGTTVNNVVVRNDGPNERLDKVNSQLRQLNQTLQPKHSREEIIESGSQTIYRKGNTTRIIRR